MKHIEYPTFIHILIETINQKNFNPLIKIEMNIHSDYTNKS